MQLLNGSLMRYSWGTLNAIPEILGVAADGKPVAEYWLGTHHLAPALTQAGSLAELVQQQPEMLGTATRDVFGAQLPFLVKILSAAHPLSLQAHPSREQAEAGFAKENAAGIGLDSPQRVYIDDWPKPEVLIALDTFETLAGFREPAHTAELFTALGVAAELESIVKPLTGRQGAAGLAQVFLDVLCLEKEHRQLIDLVAAAAMGHRDDPDEVGEFARTVIELDATFPSDRGILAALLLNRITLHPGEALFVATGQMHAHLRGTGIEVMASSDNVIRGGLTAKHIDVQELISVVDFHPTPPQLVAPVVIRPGVERYPTSCAEFDIWRMQVDGEAPIRIPGAKSARIALITDGALQVTSEGSVQNLSKGQAFLLAAEESEATLCGLGTVFVTASGLR